MPTSVSPRIRDHSLGPKPTKNSVTLIPNALATAKCAASWITITRISAKKKAPIPSAATGEPPTEPR